MADTAPTPNPTSSDSPAPARITDHRRTPAGVMPAHLQQWLIAGIAVVMVAILALAGPPKPTTPPGASTQPPLAVDPNQQRIEDYQRRVQEQAQRLAAEQAALELTKQSLNASGGDPLAGPGPSLPGIPADTRGPATPRFNQGPSSNSYDPPTYQSQSAPRVSDSVAYSSRTTKQSNTENAPSPSPGNGGLPAYALPPGFFNPVTTPIAPSPAPGTAVSAPSTAEPAPSTHEAPSTREAPSTKHVAQSTGKVLLREGTFIDAVLTNRLEGSFEGPVNALVSVPVYVDDHEVIPAGARILGTAKPVTAFGQTRLAVAFHRILLPNGERIDLDAPALNQEGDLGLHDEVDRHNGQMFGASVALGLLAGFSQGQTTAGFNADAFDRYRQGVASSFGQSSQRILDQYLNLLPTVTVREGHRIKVYIAHDVAVA